MYTFYLSFSKKARPSDSHFGHRWLLFNDLLSSQCVCGIHCIIDVGQVWGCFFSSPGPSFLDLPSRVPNTSFLRINLQFSAAHTFQFLSVIAHLELHAMFPSIPSRCGARLRQGCFSTSALATHSKCSSVA